MSCFLGTLTLYLVHSKSIHFDSLGKPCDITLSPQISATLPIHLPCGMWGLSAMLAIFLHTESQHPEL